MLSDLRITVRAHKSMNLLSKHYTFTEEQLRASEVSGSLFKKSALVKVRKIPPQPVKIEVKTLEKDRNWVPPPRSAVEIREVRYEELDIIDINEQENSDEEMKQALEMLESEIADHAPVLAKDKIYK